MIEFRDLIRLAAITADETPNEWMERNMITWDALTGIVAVGMTAFMEKVIADPDEDGVNRALAETMANFLMVGWLAHEEFGEAVKLERSKSEDNA